MILYHGCKAPFYMFDADRIGQGYEANSRLGVWATRSPHLASEYGADLCILGLSIPKPRLAAVCDYNMALYGGPDLRDGDYEIGAPVFDAVRRTLMAEGYDGVWCECPDMDLEGAVCLFDPAAIQVDWAMTDFDPMEDLFHLEDPEDDSEVDFDRDISAFAADPPEMSP